MIIIGDAFIACKSSDFFIFLDPTKSMSTHSYFNLLPHNDSNKLPILEKSPKMMANNLLCCHRRKTKGRKNWIPRKTNIAKAASEQFVSGWRWKVMDRAPGPVNRSPWNRGPVAAYLFYATARNKPLECRFRGCCWPRDHLYRPINFKPPFRETTRQGSDDLCPIWRRTRYLRRDQHLAPPSSPFFT